MNIRLFPFLVLLLFSVIVVAQTPSNITVSPEDSQGNSRGCDDQYAGTWRRGTFIGSSNDISNQVMFMCRNDQLEIIGNNDFDLSGDPNPLTAPGIGYAFYFCPPTVSGPDRASIIADPCVADDPPPANGIYIDNTGPANGNRTYINNGSLQNFFNGGNPVQLWFAPITLDDFATNGYENGGPCVHANINLSFSIVYLNQIEISAFQTSAATPLDGSFLINGGLPQWATTGPDQFYSSIIIELINDPGIRGTITNGANFSHGSRVEFSVPQPGTYRVRVTDTKSCPAEFTFSLPQQTVEICVGQGEVDPNGTICIPISFNNFTNVESFQFPIRWDPTILTYIPDPIIPTLPSQIASFTLANINVNGPNGEARVIWLSPGNNQVSIPDGTVLFELCFVATGNPGDSSYINITDRPIPIEFIANEVNAQIMLKNGGVKIRIPTQLTAYGKSCSTLTNNGSVTFSAVGGTGPYTYLLENGPSTISRNGVINNPGDWIIEGNLPPDTYSITIRDANNNVFILNLIVQNSAPMFVSLDSFDPRCFGDENGRVQIRNQDGGSAPYIFKWSTGQFGGNDIRQLGAGNYSLTVIDANGCTASASTTLGVTRINLSTTTQDPSCSGLNDGSITVTPSGGTPGGSGYTFLWSNFQTMSTLTNVGAGCYTVTVSDSNNCTVTQQACLDPVKILDIDITLNLPTCNGDLDGSIEVRATQLGGADALPYIFQWSEPGATSLPPDRSLLSNLRGNRTYRLTVTDQDGCNFVRDIELLDRIPLSVFQDSLSDESCTGPGDDGFIRVIIGGGTGNKTIVWSDGATGNERSGLSAGTYTLTATDVNGCMITRTFEIEYTGPRITLNSNAVTCPGGNDGNATVTVDYTNPFTILWSNGQTGAQINNLTAGWYIVTVTGNDGCSRTDSIEVLQPDPITVVENHTLATCPGIADAIIELIVSGGTGNYSYTWLHSGTNSNRLANQRGGLQYSVTIQDDSGCPPLMYSFELPATPLIMFRFSEITGVSCSNTDCDGSSRLELSGGAVPGGSFTVEWGTGQIVTNTSDLVLTGLCFGDNSITVTDENGCQQINLVPIPGPEPIRIDSDLSIIEPVSCFGGTDGSAEIAAAGGNAPYTYFWPVLNVNGPLVSSLSPGLYQIEITDSRGCRLDTSIIIGEPDLLVLSIDPNSTSNVGCFGIDDGQIGISISGGNPGSYIYVWTGTGATGPVASNLAPGTYSVIVTDSKGCTATTQYTLTEPVPITAEIPQPTEPLCFGLTTTVNVISASGGSGTGFTFSIDNGPRNPINSPLPVLAGQRLIRVFDDKGCSFDTLILINQPPAIIVDLGDEIEIDLGDTISLDPFIVSDLPINMYDWTNGASLSCDDCPNPSAFPGNTTTYALTVTDTNGCTGSDRVTIRVSKRRYVYIPNAFTPTGDGINDLFSVFTGKGVLGIPSMRIYNRWGALMYEQLDILPENSATTGWDGRFNGEMMDSGAYVYTIEVAFIDGAVLLYRGEVTLIR